ncbi:inositol-3-phosphate synthase [Streptomyces acidiscabies]|uniref:inositol-3-phosphate synthase n=1 Tax=Streptomyces acidiscabies TaxID=42234 RepID=UPI0009524B35|nr:inositol-3-phosphate synthase [Streptomyces acidiscabies]GAV41735.1 inositol-3-phosphate synthase [Streptomyces acidiscabies]
MALRDTGLLGVWLNGARGSVATTVVTGAAAVKAGLAPSSGCVTELAGMDAAGLVPIRDLVFGGWDVVTTPLRKRAEQLAVGGVVPAHLVGSVTEQLDCADREIVLTEAGDPQAPQAEQAEAMIAALLRFAQRTGVARTVVINIASTEAHPAHDEAYTRLDLLEAAMAERPGVLPPSALSAYAAFKAGCAFVDFTPSLGVRVPALDELARREGLPYAGSDGKTGETLAKTALAPMFAHRGLRVRSWYGANILGGGDGATLADSDACTSKIVSKQRGLSRLLGYDPEGTVHIDNVAEMGDWKTAWNHISFEGFLGVQMKMQFTWQGCDSALAAPLILDLARLMGRALESGASGPQSELAFFFKDPIGDSDPRLVVQYEQLLAWANALEATS